jgi:DNA modification methylase
MVEVFREVRRVLRDDGTLWLNLGDTYASSWPCSRRNVVGTGSLENGKREARPPRMPSGLKEKDLVGIPWRVAFALQADGWYLRQDIIWAKPNPMPESVTDRCTKAHEYVFLLTKSAKYFYDAEAIAEKSIYGGDVKRLGPKSLSKSQSHVPGRVPSGNALEDTVTVTDTRNKRSVWTIPTQAYAKAHFATFPEKLVEPCILAGCPEGGTVLDPFAGSGTTGVVAKQLNREFAGIELSQEYAAMARTRIEAENPTLF